MMLGWVGVCIGTNNTIVFSFRMRPDLKKFGFFYAQKVEQHRLK
jgi:hypothetical protein